MCSTLDGSLKKRRGYSLLYSLHSLVIASCLTDTNVCNTFICHNSLNISKVKVDKSRQIDQICDALNCLLQNLVCFTKCFRHSCAAIYNLQ